MRTHAIARHSCELPGWSKLENSTVGGIGDEKIAGVVERQTHRGTEQAGGWTISIAVSLDNRGDDAVSRNLADPISSPIRNKDITGAVNRESIRPAGFLVIEVEIGKNGRPTVTRVCTAERGPRDSREPTIRVELENTIRAREIQVAGGVSGHRLRPPD